MPARAGIAVQNFGGRPMLVYTPAHLPAAGSRALVVVLHGGLGSAQGIESGGAEQALSLDAVAEQAGFVVAYLSGTQAIRMFGSDRLAWNAGGGCCGQPAERNIDDVGYIQGAVSALAGRYGIDRSRIYGFGHSNGAMMVQRLVCETGLFAAAVPVSGPLNLALDRCPAAAGKRLLAIHGADDQNVPIAGGRGSKGPSRSVYNSEARTQQVYVASGASYTLQVVPGADHQLEHIDQAMRRSEGVSLAQKAARFFGLLP